MASVEKASAILNEVSKLNLGYFNSMFLVPVSVLSPWCPNDPVDDPSDDPSIFLD